MLYTLYDYSSLNGTRPTQPDRGHRRYLYTIHKYVQYERDEVDNNNNMFYTNVARNNRESESHLSDSVVLCRNLFPSRPPPPHSHFAPPPCKRCT